MRVVGWFFLILVGCSSAGDLRREGEAQTARLAAQLRQIHSIEELQRAVPQLKKRFLCIAELAMQVNVDGKVQVEPSLASEELFVELARLYELPGGRELIESAQAEAVERLHKAI